MVLVYKDRKDAGRQLLRHLEHMEFRNPLVLAIPRGGVVVGGEVASGLGADLDVVMAKKVGSPFNPEFAIAAVDVEGNITILEEEEHLPYMEYIQAEARALQHEIEAKLDYYRNGKPPKEILGKDVLLVDDGLATGLTALAAIKYLHTHHPNRIILAVPCAPQSTLDFLAKYVDREVCPLIPQYFYAVGQCYAEFGQTSDDEVKDTLAPFML
jgi:predicted phosphoribosyltransferase